MKQIQKEKAAELSKRTGSAKQMALEDIVAKITEGDMDGAETKTDYWSDLKHAKSVHNEANPNFGEDLNSFDAVGIIKQATDKKDKYYIYQINNRNLNNNSDYVLRVQEPWHNWPYLWMLIPQYLVCYNKRMHTSVPPTPVCMASKDLVSGCIILPCTKSFALHLWTSEVKIHKTL